MRNNCGTGNRSLKSERNIKEDIILEAKMESSGAKET